MKQNRLTFESENLVVDWVSFKFQSLEDNDQRKIVHYLSKLGFDSYQESGKLANPIKESILVSSANQFEVLFVKEGPYWQGTTLHFSGSNAAGFYSLVQKKLVNWEIFSSSTLGRFDLYFDRNYKTADKISVREFLDNCQKNLKQKNKNISLEKNNRGLVLKIGNRRSNNYSRIYQTKNSLRFEHEMKGKVLQQYYLLLVENRLEQFEQKLSFYFTLYFGKLLPLQHSYLDWLVIQLRPMRRQSCLQSALKADYIQSEIKSDSRKFVMLIQFLNYAQHLDFEIKYIDQISYRVVGFRLQDFLRFQNKYNNQYQLTKVKEFFEEVQTGILLTSFSDNYFQSLVAIPLVKFHKIQKFWVGRVWLAEELFYYKYPFLLPDFFKTKLTKDQFEVRVEVIKVFHSVDITKIFLIQQFLDSYSTVSNQRINKIKKNFIELVEILQEYDLIESNYKIISNGSFLDTNELNISNISEGFVIYEKIYI